MRFSAGWWTALLRPNWQLKVLAVLLAVITYTAIRGVTGYEVEYAVPVMADVEEGLAVLAINPDTVEVRFRGTQDDLLKLDQQRLQARISVRGDNPQGVARPVPVGPRDIAGARGVSIVSVDPPDVMITFDREEEATFTVAKPDTVGSPLLGNVEIQYTPQVVTVRGPRKRIAELKASGHDAVTPEPVDVDGRVESFSRRVRVQPPGGAWASKIEPDEITVQVNLVKKSVTRTWEALPVRVLGQGGADGGAVVAPATVQVTLEGRSELLESLQAGDLLIFVDGVGLDPAATHEAPVHVHLPTYMDVRVTVVPRTVQVSFTAEVTAPGR